MPPRHATPAERAEHGKRARADAAGRAHAELGRRRAAATPSRCSRSRRASRVPELVPIRYGRMLASPFAFYRGGGHHGGRPRRRPRHRACTCSCAATPTCPTSAPSPSPDRRLVFDINDFDETLPGPFEWDVKRLVGQLRRRRPRQRASRQEAARDRRWRRRAPTARRCGRSPAMGTLDVWYTRLDVDDDLRALRRRQRRAEQAQRVEARRQGAQPKDSLQALDQAHRRSSTATPRIVSDPPVIVPIEELVPAAEATRSATTSSRGVARHVPAHAAGRPPRTCSSGTSSSTSRARSSASAASARAPGSCCCRPRRPTTRCSCRSRRPSPRCSSRTSARSRYEQPRPAGRRGPAPDAGGERHPARLGAGRRVSTARSATSTSASCGTGRVRRSVEQMTPTGMRDLRPAVRLDARPRPRPLGRPRSRSPRYLGGATRFDQAMADFAETYADQNERDHAALRDAVGAEGSRPRAGV